MLDETFDTRSDENYELGEADPQPGYQEQVAQGAFESAPGMIVAASRAAVDETLRCPSCSRPKGSSISATSGP